MAAGESKPGWDPQLYLRYAAQRGSAALDLIHSLQLEPRTIADLGCGPGNSTEMLHARWPNAAIIGIDNDQPMIASARKAHPDWKWELSGIEEWQPAQAFDLVFSNAALHWLPDHARLFPHLFGFVAEGGAFAVQMPQNQYSRVHAIMRDIAESDSWRIRFNSPIQHLTNHPPDFYYDLLAPLAARLDLRETTYTHELESPDAIIKWVRATGMRVYLNALPPQLHEAFEADCLAETTRQFSPQANGKYLLPYPRIFVVGYRG